jgi:hypothetical protein
MPDLDSGSENQPLRSGLQVFFIKLFGVTAALLIACSWTVSSIKSAIQDAPMLRGGSVFWETVENRLYKLADEDLPAEKKAKIIEALRKLSAKYAPYVEALTAPAKKT